MTATPNPNPTSDPAASKAARLADQLERSFRGGAWHGPAFAEALSGVDAATAARRPFPDGHTIWEIVGHVSIWLEMCRRRIGGEPIHDLPLDDDWPPPVAGEEGDTAWRRELDTLEERFRGFHATVSELDDSRLDDPVAGSDPTLHGLLLGMLQHHAYHGGQIVLLKKSGGPG